MTAVDAVARPPLEEMRGAWWDLVGLFTAQAVALALSLIYLSLIATALGPVHFGLVAVFLSVTQLVFNLTVNWSQGATVRFGKEEVLRTGGLGETFWARQAMMLTAIGMGGVALAGGQDVLGDYLGAARPATWWVIPFVVIHGYAQFGAALLQAIGKIGYYSTGLVVRQLVLCGGALVMLAGPLPRDFRAVVAIELVGYLAVVLVAAPAFRRSLAAPVRLSRSRLRAVWKYSWPALLTVAGGYLVTWFHVVAINHFFGPDEVGRYQVGFRAIFLLGEGLGSIATVLFPLLVAVRAAGGGRDADAFYVGRLTPQLSFLWALATMTLIAAAPFALPALGGAAYEVTLPITTLLAAGLGSQMVGVMYSAIFSASGRLGWPMVVALSTGTLNSIALWLVVPHWGLLGAAGVNVVCMIGSAAAYVWAGNRVVGIVTWRAFLGPALTLVMVAAALLWPDVRYRFTALIALALLGVVWGKRLRLFQAEDVAWFRPVAMPRIVRRGLVSTYAWLS